MYQRVIFGDEIKTEGGMKLGKSLGIIADRILFENEEGKSVVAAYGIVDENGKFHEFCRETVRCGSACFDRDKHKCRYNSTYQNTAGYYVCMN